MCALAVAPQWRNKSSENLVVSHISDSLNSVERDNTAGSRVRKTMSIRSRYQNYGQHSRSSSSSSFASSYTGELDKRCHSNREQSDECVVEHHTTNGLRDSNERTSYSSRLEYIVHSMAYIRGELDDLKESDRTILDIFKQLESNVEELNDNISNWRSFTPGRLASVSDLDDPSLSRGNIQPDCQGGEAYTMNSLETILDSSKEDITLLKEDSNESDSALVADNSSISCSPVLPSTLKFQFSNAPSSIRSSCGSGSAAAKRFSDSNMQLRGSMSFNKLANSPSISRLQDDGESTMSRNSSIDSGIQFASEVESICTSSVMETVVHPPAVEVLPEDMRKSVGFADDIFAALGL